MTEHQENNETMNQNEDPTKQQQGTTPQSTSSSSSSSSSSTTITAELDKGKSCKGSLYYSSTFKSNARNPLCVGFTRALSHVPVKASIEGKNTPDFKYGCLGYSLYKDCKNQQIGAPDSQTDLPLCVGLEVLVNKKPEKAESSAVIHNKEDGKGSSLPRTQKPAHSFTDEFLGKFTRNAKLVAKGVQKNLCKVGSRIKDSIDDIYPYKRPPK